MVEKKYQGKKPDDEPSWYKILDPLFTETHAPIKTNTECETSFLNDSDSPDEEEEEEKPNSPEETWEHLLFRCAVDFIAYFEAECSVD